MIEKQTAEGWYVIDGDTHISKWVEDSKKLDHDEFLIPIACDNIPEGGIVIDVGAMLGSHSIAYAKKVGSNGTVICCEPGKLAFGCLSKNADKFESEVIVLNVAVCEVHGGNALYSLHQTNAGMSTVHEDGANCSAPTFHEIKTVSIDGLANDAGLPRLDFIKLDCEGWEFKALKGAQGSIKQFKPKLLIEINSFTLAEQGDSPKQIYDLLLALNYQWQIVQPNAKGGDLQFDVMAWPNMVQTTGNVALG